MLCVANGESRDHFDIASAEPYFLPEVATTSEMMADRQRTCILSGLTDGRVVLSSFTNDAVDHNEYQFDHHCPVSSISCNKYNGLVRKGWSRDV